MWRGRRDQSRCQHKFEKAVPLRQLRLKILARQHRHQLLQVQPYWDFNNTIIVSSPYEPRFVLVPIRFASEAWPRPGLAWLRLASPGFAQASPSLEAPRLQACININRKGKIVMKIQEASFWVRFLHLKLIWFLETDLGPPLFEALIANSMLVCVTLMCFYIGTAPEEGAWVGLKPDLQGGTGFNLLRVHFWTPVQRKRASKRGQKVDPLEIKNGPAWRVQFWYLFGPFIVANLLRRLFQVEADLHPSTKLTELREFVAWAKNSKVDFPLYLGGDFNQVDTSCSGLWNDLLIHTHVLDTCPRLNTFEGPTGSSALDRILCPTEYITAAQMDVLVSATRRHHLSGHYQLTATFVVRPKVKSDVADPIHQTIPSEVFCPGKNEANPYNTNDLQELIRRIQRLPQTDEVDFVAALWSWWRQQPIPSNHPRIPEYELLRKFLKIRAEVPDVPDALQAATYHIFASNVISEIYPGKMTIRSDLLRQIFDFLDQITVTRRYPDLEQVNQQARGIGNNITFWNRLRAMCPKGLIYNGPVLNRQEEQCIKMLDEAMLDTRHFWFVKPQDSIQEWEPILNEYQTALPGPWPNIEIPEKQDFLHTLLSTKDSAPGPDGIPYSAWRLSPEDSYPVLDQLMMTMLAGLRAAPVQVGVWIPKAKVGPTADYFRPLGMPNTCDRLVDGTIAAVVQGNLCLYASLASCDELFQRTPACSPYYSGATRQQHTHGCFACWSIKGVWESQSVLDFTYTTNEMCPNLGM